MKSDPQLRDPQLRREALKHWRKAYGAWGEARQARDRRSIVRFVRAANRAETVLFRLICSDLDEVAPRVAYGLLALRRSTIYGQTRIYDQAASAARGALWAVDREEFALAYPQKIESAVLTVLKDPPAPSEFVMDGSGTAQLTSAYQTVLAAEARVLLAEQLNAFRPAASDELMTRQDIDATLRSRDKYRRSDEPLAWTCQTAFCQGKDGIAEATILANEARGMVQLLTDLNRHVIDGQDHAAKLQPRLDTLFGRLPPLRG